MSIAILKNGNLVQKERLDRSTYIGGSDIAAIMGVNPYKTALDVYNEKINGKTTEKNIAMRLGLHCESVILDIYEEEMVHPAGVRDVIVKSSEYDFMRCQVDWMNSIECDFICDAKLAGQYRQQEFGDDFSSLFPVDYKHQLAYQRRLTGCSYADLMVLFAPTHHQILRYEIDERFEQNIIDNVIDFWNNHILKRIPPFASSSKEFNEIFPASNGLSIDADQEILSKLVEIHDIKTQLKHFTDKTDPLIKRKESLELEVKRYMGANEKLLYGGEKVASLATTNRKGFYVEPTSYRTLRISL